MQASSDATGHGSGKAATSDLKTVSITIIAGLISAVAAIGGAYLTGFFDVAKTNAANAAAIDLERLKFSNELIKNALATSNSANSLLFYADIGLLNGLNTAKVKDYAQREAERLKSGDKGSSLLPSFDKSVRPQFWLDRAFLMAVAPHASPRYVDAFVSTGNYLLLGFGINANAKRLSNFLGQLAQETGGFSTTNENANYSSTARLIQIWPSEFNDQNVNEYVNNPEKILSRAYANKLGNGSEGSGDGWKYRGRGLLQVTGRAGYDRFSKETGIDLINNPDSMDDPYVALLIAASFWYNNGLNDLADQDKVEEITTRFVGSSSGLEGRKHWTAIIFKHLSEKM